MGGSGLLCSISSELAGGQVTFVGTVLHHLLAQDLVSELLDGFVGEQTEGLRDGDRGDAGLLAVPDVLHHDDLLRRLVCQVLLWVENDMLESLFQCCRFNDGLE